MRLPRSGAGWTIAVFGVLALVMGAVGLLWPEAQLRLLGFEVPEQRAPGDYTGTFLMASSMASFNMGVYYLLATATEWRAFFRFTVFFRLVTFSVFTLAVLADIAPDRFFGVAAWEGLGALATFLGLRWDARAGSPVASADGAGPVGTEKTVSAGGGDGSGPATAASADTAR
ncbi:MULTISPECIES: hypothetical protein [Micromonospora]|uniref:DUF4345 domain-containing protein n=1 Tax=Micromonospora yangpuensis TaxID=683228 RepID=A0A1C6VFF0_9ACTN|nr:hypothetical protein [Micromonospora yangpuensis]GGM31725.1 hypothetical protein GCM10012279_58240 [Micromonospora yangpuensis]SCL65066.1 hypothetical protein GA0070617_5646 [Micromonospora yangpuensis]